MPTNPEIEIIQINISGPDKPGMTSSLTDILARYDALSSISVRPTSTNPSRSAFWSGPLRTNRVPS